MLQPDVPQCPPNIAAHLSVIHPVLCVYCICMFFCRTEHYGGRSRERTTQPLMTCSPIGGPLPAQLFYVYMLKLEFSEKAGALNETATHFINLLWKRAVYSSVSPREENRSFWACSISTLHSQTRTSCKDGKRPSETALRIAAKKYVVVAGQFMLHTRLMPDKHKCDGAKLMPRYRLKWLQMLTPSHWEVDRGCPKSWW